METEHKIEQVKLDEMKKIIEQEITEYARDHSDGAYGYLNNFNKYLHNDSGDPLSYRDHLFDERYQNKTPRQDFEEHGNEYRDLNFSSKYLDTTYGNFLVELDYAMKTCGVSSDETTYLIEEMRRLQTIRHPDSLKMKKVLEEKMLPIYIYMRALGYNHYPDLTC